MSDCVFLLCSKEKVMGQAARVARSIDLATGREMPVGYVFMLASRPRGPMRATRAEALKDAVEAKEAFVDPELGVIFQGPLTWIAPIYP
jgi:hypothetical protein